MSKHLAIFHTIISLFNQLKASKQKLALVSETTPAFFKTRSYLNEIKNMIPVTGP